jgi:hypothetical protein
MSVEVGEKSALELSREAYDHKLAERGREIRPLLEAEEALLTRVQALMTAIGYDEDDDVGTKDSYCFDPVRIRTSKDVYLGEREGKHIFANLKTRERLNQTGTHFFSRRPIYQPTGAIADFHINLLISENLESEREIAESRLGVSRFLDRDNADALEFSDRALGSTYIAGRNATYMHPNYQARMRELLDSIEGTVWPVTAQS